MKEERIYDGITNIREDFIEKADEYIFSAEADGRMLGKKKPVRRFPSVWLTLAVTAACLLLALGTPFVHMTVKRCGSDQPVGTECEEHAAPVSSAPGECKGEEIVTEETVWVYYVENGEVCSELCTVKWLVMDVFAAWKEKNGIGEEVLLLDYEPWSEVTEQGESMSMHVIVSKSLESYYDRMDEDLLLESLKQTLSGYFGPHFTEYHFTLE